MIGMGEAGVLGSEHFSDRTEEIVADLVLPGQL